MTANLPPRRLRYLLLAMCVALFVLSLVGFISFGFFNRLPLNAIGLGLGILTMIGFVWFGLVKQRVLRGLTLAVVYLGFAVPLILLGWMDAYVIHMVLPIVGGALLLTWMYRLDNVVAALALAIVLSVAFWALYALKLIPGIYALFYSVSAVGTLIGWYLFRRARFAT